MCLCPAREEEDSSEDGDLVGLRVPASPTLVLSPSSSPSPACIEGVSEGGRPARRWRRRQSGLGAWRQGRRSDQVGGGGAPWSEHAAEEGVGGEEGGLRERASISSDR
jgi:hypothetical protein